VQAQATAGNETVTHGTLEVSVKPDGRTMENTKPKMGIYFYYSGELDKHMNSVGFLVNKTINNAIIGCCPISNRLISIRLRVVPFNITVIQVYAPTSAHDDMEVEEFYHLLQANIDRVDKKDILIIQGDWNWNAKVGTVALKNWSTSCVPSCNDITNERGLRLMEFASYNNLILPNTLGIHKPSQRWTWHAPNGAHHYQIDYILVQNRFRSGINRTKTRTFPGAEIGSDNRDRLKDLAIVETFQAVIGGKFAPLLATLDEDAETLTSSFNTVMTKAAQEVLGKRRRKVQPWVTEEILDMCDTRRKLKKVKNTTGENEYKKVNKKIRKV